MLPLITPKFVKVSYGRGAYFLYLTASELAQVGEKCWTE